MRDFLISPLGLRETGIDGQDRKVLVGSLFYTDGIYICVYDVLHDGYHDRVRGLK